MATLTSTEQTLYECIARGDLINAQNVLQHLLESPKYSDDSNAAGILKSLETGSISSAQETLGRYLRTFYRMEKDASTFLRQSEEAALRGQMLMPEAVSEFVRITAPDDIDTGLHLCRQDEEDLIEDIGKVYHNAKELSRFGIRHLNSTLLHGLPGTGKTTFAGLLAKRLGLPLLSVKVSSLVSCRLGETGRNITRIFEFADKCQCVLFIDELDSFGMKRGESREVAEMGRVTIALMQMLDTLPSGFVLVAATNRPDVLDPALVRRFARNVEVRPFSRDEAIQMVIKTLEKVFPGAFTEEMVHMALPMKAPMRDSFVPSEIAGKLEHGIVTSWPERPDLRKVFDSWAERHRR